MDEPSTNMPFLVPQSGGSLHRFVRGAWALVVALIAELFSSCFPKTANVGGRTLHLVRLLAEGGYGFVWLARDYGRGGALFALKQLVCTTAEQSSDAAREADLHAALSHPHLMPLLGRGSVRRRDGREVVSLLFPLMEGGSVQDTINRALAARPAGAAAASGRGGGGGGGGGPSSAPSPLPEAAALHAMLGAARGLLALHAAGYAHRDVCPRNILLRADGTAVVSDFGSAQPVRVRVSTRADAAALLDEAASHSSPPYRAPELWSIDPGEEITGACDTWSLGCSLYASVCGFSPFESVRAEDGRLRLVDPTHVRVLGPLAFPSHPAPSPGLASLLTAMLDKDPRARLSLDEAAARMEGLLRERAAGGEGLAAKALQALAAAEGQQGEGGGGVKIVTRA
jgi:serine/threonine kinase 16